MKYFIKNIKSENYKLTHSILLLIHLLIPIIGVIIFLSYYKISALDEIQKVSIYFQVLCMAFPFLISMITVISSEQESEAGAYQLMLSSIGKKSIPHLSKITILLLFGFLSLFISIISFGYIFNFMGNKMFSIGLYYKVLILFFIGYVPLYILQYILSFAFGKGTGIGFGIIGSLLSALLMTGLGNKLWNILPWSISIRFCNIIVECKAQNLNFMNVFGVKKGLLFIVISSFILLNIFNFWSNKWEGRKDE